MGKPTRDRKRSFAADFNSLRLASGAEFSASDLWAVKITRSSPRPTHTCHVVSHAHFRTSFLPPNHLFYAIRASVSALMYLADFSECLPAAHARRYSRRILTKRTQRKGSSSQRSVSVTGYVASSCGLSQNTSTSRDTWSSSTTQSHA